MNLLKNNQQKINDIIFANKNKKYGAYAIRSEYDNSIIKSLSIVFSTVMLFAASVFLYNRNHEEKIEIQMIPQTIDSTIITIMNLEDMFKKPEPKSNPEKANPANNQKNNNLSTLISDTASVETSTIVNSNTVAINISTVTGIGDNPDAKGTNSLATGGGTVSGGGDTGPVLFSDEMPEFEGGIGAIKKFISQNISYPEKAKILEREGTVRVSFVVNEQGNVVDVKVADGIGAGCDEEALRVISKLPKFKKPGKNAGKAVKVMFYIPIKFRLQ